jgi:branched-chain amino acid transport system substrate-binding protein
MFLPGGMGISFLRQMRQADVSGIPFFAATTMNESVIATLGEAARDVIGSTTWGPDLDNTATRKFVSAFREAYKRTPTVYAANGYDTARLIGSALQATKGNVSNLPEVRKALLAVKYDSLRGKMSFGQSQYPIADWYMTKVVKTESGSFAPRISQKLLANHGSPHAGQCRL